jgi:molybdate transport system substrate-binding protein
MKRLIVRATLALIAISMLSAGSAAADELTLIAPGGIREPLQKLVPQFERLSGHKVKMTIGSGNGTRAQVKNGEFFDVPIVQPPLDDVLATNLVIKATETPLATVAVALAVRKGAAKPDISNADAVRKVLLAARSVSIPDRASGAAAGVSFDETLKLLGIVEQMKPTLKRVQGGAGAMAAISKGQVEIGLTFLSEIHDPGVEVVGALPREISIPTGLVGYVHAHSKSPQAAKALLDYLSSPAAAVVYREFGMQPGN